MRPNVTCIWRASPPAPATLRSLACGRRSLSNPCSRLIGLRQREDPHLARLEEAEDVECVADPRNIGDHRDALSAPEFPQTHLEVVPQRCELQAREVAIHLAVDVQLLLALGRLPPPPGSRRSESPPA